MTALGAAIYGGFFGLAALWLFLTQDGPGDEAVDGQGQRQDRSNSTSVLAGAEGSSPRLLTHSSQK